MESLKWLTYVATERVGKNTCETWDCTRRSVAGHGKPDVDGGPGTGSLHDGGT